MHTLSYYCSNRGWLWLLLLSLPLYSKFSDLCINLLNLHTKKICLQSSTGQGYSLINLQLTPIGPVKWWCGTFACRFHIRSFQFYGSNTELSQLSIFHIISKGYDNILFLCSGVEFQCKVNNDTSTPWEDIKWGLEWHEIENR